MNRKTLVAGIGNVFLGDDGFGVAVAARLVGEPLPAGVRIIDIGIRARDLAYELLDGRYDTAILVDAVARGDAPGTLSVIEPLTGEPIDRSETTFDAHAMTPDSVLSFLNTLGGVSTRIRIVGCEPACLDEGIGLSAPVTAAVGDAVALIRELVSGREDACAERAATPSGGSGTCV
jgi:hydrogenase maturation protease